MANYDSSHTGSVIDAAVTSVVAVDPVTTATSNLGLGATIASGYSLTCAGNMIVSGILTATSFSGNGSNISGIPVTTVQKVITFSFLS